MHSNAWWIFYYFLTQFIPSSCVLYTCRGTKVIPESLLIDMIIHVPVVNNQENVHRWKTGYQLKWPTSLCILYIATSLIHACSKYHHLLFNSLFVLGIFCCQLKAYLITSLELLLLNCWSLQNMPYWTNLRVTGASDTMLFIVFFLHQVMFLHIKGWLMIWASSLNWWTSLSLIDKGNSLQRSRGEKGKVSCLSCLYLQYKHILMAVCEISALYYV